MRTISHFVNGQTLEGTSGRFGDVFNPNTGEVQARVPLATDAELDAAVQPPPPPRSAGPRPIPSAAPG